MNSYINEDNGIFASWAPENYEINNNNAALQLAVQAAYGPELQNIIIDLQYQQRHALSSPPVGSRRQGLQQHHSLSARCNGCLQTEITTDSLTDTTSTTPTQPPAACCGWLLTDRIITTDHQSEYQPEHERDGEHYWTTNGWASHRV
mmetsp:Transcript_43868/g.82044  ORF Transcript_43868/g.82044 Transcript_43868/m.82044 type:complete len:147 (+) Transcript_43868:98-538(+)